MSQVRATFQYHSQSILSTLVQNEVEIFTEISIYAGCKICHPSDQISKTITLKYFIVYQYLVIRYNLAN